METIIKNALIFVAGAVVGGGAAYYIVNSINEAKNEKVISDRVEAAVKQYKAHELAKLNSDIMSKVKNSIVKTNESEKVTSEEIEEYRDKLNRLPYSNIQTSVVEEPKEAPDDDDIDIPVVKHNAFKDSEEINEDEIMDEEEDDDIPEQGSNKAPYIISPEEYQHDYVDEYDKDSLIFFKDNILTDQDFAEVSPNDAEKLLGGAKLFTAFGSKGAKKDRVYIRNERLHTDYEIVHSPRKYTQDVLHMEDEEEE